MAGLSIGAKQWQRKIRYSRVVETGPAVGNKPGPANQKLVSRTEPEATLVDRPDFGRHRAYKAHLSVAGRQGQVITAAVATTGAAADEHLLAEVLWQHRRLSRLGVPEVVADAKYGTTGNFLYLANSVSRPSFPLPASATCAMTAPG